MLIAHHETTPRVAAEVGMPLGDVPTPALVIDLARMERNIERFHGTVRERGKRLRSPIKTHKVPTIGLAQIEAGACGIAAAKPSEAQPFHDAGCLDIVLTFPSVGPDKWARLATLARDAHVTANVDSDEQARGLSDAAVAAEVTIFTQIEIDSGFHRVGLPLEDVDEIADFARLLRSLPGLELEGITTHRGKFGPRLAEMTGDEAGKEEGEILVALAERLRGAGIPVREVTAGGTITGRGVALADGITEVRAGTYVFYDAMMEALGAAEPDELAATILTTVVSVRRPGWATVDAGTKTFSGDRGMVGAGANASEVVSRAVDREVELVRLTEEHGMARLGEGVSVEIGERLQFVPYHICTAVNLSNELIGVRDGTVEAVWPVTARGCRT